MSVSTDWIDIGVAGLTISDLTVLYLDLEANPLVWGTYDSADGLSVEYATAHVRDVVGSGPVSPAPATLFRLNGVPDADDRRRLQVYETATPANSVGVDLDPQNDAVREVLALFQSSPGSQPVMFTFTDADGDPIAGVQVSIWSDDLAVPVVPQVTSTSAGGVTVYLPAGDYKAFYFKAYTSFDTSMPVDLTVATTPVSISETAVVGFPSLPTLPRVTFYGWILQPDLTPVVGTEVKMKILDTPQIVTGGVALSQYEMIATTDAAGRFELYPLGGADVLVTSVATMYHRKGRLPKQGSVNWADFAKETI